MTKGDNKFGIQKGQPLRLPNGTVINKTEDGQTDIKTAAQQKIVASLDEILSDVYVDDDIETFQRTLADINVVKAEFNPVMLVLSYAMWGLDEQSIARYLEISVEQVEAIQCSDLYSRTRKEMLEAIRYAEASSIHGYIQSKARAAAKTVVAALASPKEDVSFAAAKDILDRSGFRPVDKVEHTHKFDDDLRIVHLHQAKPVDIDIGI